MAPKGDAQSKEKKASIVGIVTQVSASLSEEGKAEKPNGAFTEETDLETKGDGSEKSVIVDLGEKGK